MAEGCSLTTFDYGALEVVSNVKFIGWIRESMHRINEVIFQRHSIKIRLHCLNLYFFFIAKPCVQWD